MRKRATRHTIMDAVKATKEVPHRPTMFHAPTRQDLIEDAYELALSDELADDYAEIDQLAAEYMQEIDRAVQQDCLRMKLKLMEAINNRCEKEK